MKPSIFAKLSLMLLEYLIWGSRYVTMGTYMSRGKDYYPGIWSGNFVNFTKTIMTSALLSARQRFFY